MITPSDKSYKATKQVMLGKKTIKEEFQPLAKWIDETYDVKTINILYDTFDKGTPRLEICFEFESEESTFMDDINGIFDRKKQRAIGEKFKETIKEPFSRQYKTDDVWVIYGAFEPIARMEANENVPQRQVMQLKDELNNGDLWEISRSFSATTFFVYTVEQVKKYESSATRKIWADRYFDILEPYNEFGYFKRDTFNIYLDSKENFDNNYESNWYYYYK